MEDEQYRLSVVLTLTSGRYSGNDLGYVSLSYSYDELAEALDGLRDGQQGMFAQLVQGHVLEAAERLLEHVETRVKRQAAAQAAE